MQTPEQLLTEHRAILLEQIEPSPTSAQAARRKSFDKGKLQELADSILQLGLVNPIVVRPIPTRAKHPGCYELVAGERRFLAAQLAGLERIDCSVRYLGDEEVVEIQLIENLQRADLHPMHEAESYDELIHTYKHTADEIAAKIGKSRGYVYGRMKLLALSKACRKAFHGDSISASIAEKLARIPTPELQDEALEAVLGNPNAKETWKRRPPMSYRDAVEHINEHFMLDLSQAPFPTDDPDLNNAGTCAKCPKRTGNQPELFDDVKKGNTCTDTTCFAAKTRAYGQRLLEKAKETGQRTITGSAAKKIAPHGAGHYLGEGYAQLGDKQWHGSKEVEVRKLLKTGAAIELLQDPSSGRVVEVVHHSQLKQAKSTASANASNAKWEKDKRQKAARAKTETAVRRAVFAAIAAKGKWKAPPLRQLAELIGESMDWHAGEALMQILEAPPGDHRRLASYIESLKTDAQLETFVAQAYLADELHVNSYEAAPKFPRLEAAAKAARVDVKKIRRELAPKQKAAAGRKRK